MCEPAHSIVQYNCQDDHNDDDFQKPFSSQMDQESRIKAALGKVLGLGRRISHWLHFSKLGNGHSGVVDNKLSPQLTEFGHADLILPRDTKYENNWWDRKVVFDGRFNGPLSDREPALTAATIYAECSCLGNMSLFRRFLEQSIKNSERFAHRYVERFIEGMLTVDGRIEFTNQLKQVGRGKLFDLFKNPNTKDAALAKLMKMTRQRKLLLPHWADNNTLWTP
jgi:hypothetical protein